MLGELFEARELQLITGEETSYQSTLFIVMEYVSSTGSPRPYVYIMRALAGTLIGDCYFFSFFHLLGKYPLCFPTPSDVNTE